MAKYIEAPDDWIQNSETVNIFLAGSIENGKAEDWQSILSDVIGEHFDDRIQILNPRRKNWNPDANHEELTRQIQWEQRAIKMADIVAFHFDPKTKSPISLLELGQCIGSKRNAVVVHCPATFFRFTNVQVTCGGYGVTVHTDDELFVADLFRKITVFV